MKIKLLLGLAACAILCLSASAASTAPTRGNSSYGTGTGVGSWNLATTSPFSVGGASIVEQTVCPTASGGVCPDDSTYLFQIQSDLTNPSVALTGLSGFTFDSSATATFGVMLCNESSGNGPGPLCTDPANTVYPNVTYTCNGGGACTGAISSLDFSVPGDAKGLTFFAVESGSTVPGVCINGSCSSTTAPEPGSLLLLGTGLIGVWWRRRSNP